MLADIADFGFDETFQTVYIDEEQGKIRGVYLCFYANFLLYCKKNEVNTEFLEQLFSMYTPDVIMGNTEDVRKVQWVLSDYTMESRGLYQFCHPEELAAETTEIQKAVPEDVDDIFAFLQSIPELKHLYTSKQMIADRIGKNCGTHYIVRENGNIIAHANSAAESEFTTMIGGVSTADAYRGKGLAGQIVSKLCRDIQERGKQPTLFSIQGEENNLYSRIGFRKIGEWGTLTRTAGPDKESGTADSTEDVKSSKEVIEEDANRVKSEKRPSYIALYDELYRDIVQGVYEKDSLLPSENVLSEKYHVSRNTLRQALAILNQDGYIYRKQGKGTYVSYDSEKKEKERIYNFLTEDTLERIINITLDYNIGKPTLIAKTKLELQDGEEVLASNNVYESENGPIGQSFLQIPMWVLEQEEVDVRSEEQLLALMNEKIYRRASGADMTIQLMEADEQVVPYLNVEPGTMLLHFEQLLYDKNQRPTARIKYYFCTGKYQIRYRL